MKSTIYENKQLEEKILVTRAKELWLNEGDKIKDIQTLNLYIKPDDHSVYFVINNIYSGHFAME